MAGAIFLLDAYSTGLEVDFCVVKTVLMLNFSLPCCYGYQVRGLVLSSKATSSASLCICSVYVPSVLRAFVLVDSVATSLATLDDFVPVMLEAEEENYNLFKLINELNREVRTRTLGLTTIRFTLYTNALWWRQFKQETSTHVLGRLCFRKGHP